ncbi:SapC family protein [Sphingomonas sp. HHU CXW]|uniref:SapC family protein n=1 Tax=Sphingomonas hominis TaxID=2741495 RepID=A0ABX2JLF5_9SPHN|nr:SapC family protein [Sphingomonas hominis]NTS65561.1 SapC family protein [Sphingomonas hominis]
MPIWEMLNRQDHGSLRVSRKSDAQRHFAQIVPAEFLQAAPYYAILFTKHPDTGAFYAGVVMGLEPDENLLVVDDTLPDYRPADLERRGFFTTPDGIAIDRDDPVFADPAGQTLFGIDGEPALALRRVQQALHTLEVGLSESDALIARLLSHRLLEPIDVKMEFDDGRSLRLDGLYTISLDALHALPDEVALDLFRSGDLQLAYAQTGSVRHLRTLGRIRNARL